MCAYGIVVLNKMRSIFNMAIISTNQSISSQRTRVRVLLLCGKLSSLCGVSVYRPVYMYVYSN